MRWIVAAATVALLAPAVPAAATASTPLVPHANGTWTYDSTGPGQWTGAIADYDAAAAPVHDISVVLSYATDLEMYCPHDDPAQCRAGDLYSYYTAGSSGPRATAAYARGVPGAIMAPIIDGVVGSDYLAGFNELSPALAATFADKVAGQVCADPLVAGISFDLEPFDVGTHNGQYWFYREIADAFARGACVDSSHPSGRFFSVFTFADALRPATASAHNVAELVHRKHNGYVLDSLYDLGTRPGGWLNAPDRYQRLVTAQVTQMRSRADRLGIRYGFGVPGGASAHEYTTCAGTPCRHDAGAGSGYPMLQYTKAAIAAVDASGARADGLFTGNYLWYFGAGPQHHPGYDVSPVPVPSAVRTYLTTRL